MPLPARYLKWHLALQLPAGFEWLSSADAAENKGAAIIGLKSPATACYPGGPPVISQRCEALSIAASYLAKRTVELWKDVLGTADVPQPTLVIVDRPDSTFCYARNRFIRLPVGIFGRFGATTLIVHEAGHLFWGIRTRFAQGSEWLSEALAQYSVHLAEANGLFQNYSRSAQRALIQLCNGSLRHKGLAELAAARDKPSAAVLRAKGGFMIAALRQVVGDGVFRALMQTAFHKAVARELDVATFVSLAENLHGRSLARFVDQWVGSDTRSRSHDCEE